MRKSSRNSEIILFDAFVTALKTFMVNEKVLFAQKKRKYPLVHRLAMYLEEELPAGLCCDMLLTVELKDGDSTPDLVVNDRNGNIALAIYVKDGYLSRKDQQEARRFHREIECLTLAFAFLEGKDYFLIYRFGSSFTDYLHLSQVDFRESLLKRCETDSDETFSEEQLLLGIRPKRSHRKKATSTGDVPLL